MSTTDDLTQQVVSMLSVEYDRLNDARTIAIKPADLADKVYRQLDKWKRAPRLVQWMAQLEMRQLARALCRQHNGNIGVDDTQIEMFDDQLQDRYPGKREGDEAYILRLEMTLAERSAFSARMRSEIGAKTRHADAFDAETEKLVASGYFHDDEAA